MPRRLLLPMTSLLLARLSCAAQMQRLARLGGEAGASVAEEDSEAEGDAEAEEDMDGDQTSFWCRGRCLTQFERNYLQEHAEELAPALEALRAPGCVPPGRVVVTSGYYRTGSTLLFNTVRLLLELAFPGRTVSGFGCNHKESLFKNYPPNLTTVCKEHTINAPLVTRADVVVMSRRSVWESVCSRTMRRKWTWSGARRRCPELMNQQAHVYRMLNSDGRGVAHDMLLSDFHSRPEAEVPAIAAAVGICEGARGSPALVRFVKSMAENLESNYEVDTMITQMHPPHTEKDREGSCEEVQKVIESDPVCKRWADANASITANEEFHRKSKVGQQDWRRQIVWLERLKNGTLPTKEETARANKLRAARKKRRAPARQLSRAEKEEKWYREHAGDGGRAEPGGTEARVDGRKHRKAALKVVYLPGMSPAVTSTTVTA